MTSGLEAGVEAIYKMVRQGQGPTKDVQTRRGVAVVLWRRQPENQSENRSGMEVFLGQRAYSMQFMPGLWTFPGGLIDAGDLNAPIAGATGERAQEIAAVIREVREETGLELPAHADCYTFLGRLSTPDIAPLQFDSGVYMVEVSADDVVDYRASQGELRDGVWMDPDSILAAPARASWLMPEPTRAVLQAIAPGLDGLAARCQRACEQSNHMARAYLIAPGIWLSPVRTPTLPPATTTNCYTIGADELIVIDPASPYDPERAALDQGLERLRAEGRRVVEIWLTHHHGDHMSGAAYLAARLGVPVAAHPLTAERVADRVNITRHLHDGDVRELAGDPPRRVRVVFTPGHAPGHICVLDETTGFLVAGDMVAGVGTILVEPVEGDMRLYLESLRRMRDLEPDALLPAHGPLILNPRAKLDEYIKHRLWREQRVLDALRELGPAASRTLVPQAYSDTPPMVWPLAERSLIAHLHKLERDGLASRDDSAARQPVWQLVGQ